MKKEKVISRRLDYIDIAKRIGIIAVMLSHGVGFPGNTEYYFIAYPPNETMFFPALQSAKIVP